MKSLEWFLYEDDSISALLLQFIGGRYARLLPYFDAARYKMSVAFLAVSKSNQLRSFILNRFLYEDNFIYAGLLQVAIRRDARHTRNSLPVRRGMALAA